MFRALVRYGAVTLTAAVALLSLPVAHAQTEQQNLVNRAQATFDNFLRDPQMTWLHKNVSRAKGLLIAPEVVKAGFIFGGSGGRAVLFARDPQSGKWRGPVFYTMATASVGFQAGVAASENVTMVMTERGLNTLLATSVKLGKRLAKVPVVVGNCFGFVANRMLAYYMREAYLLLEEGASVPQIDRVLTEFGLPVGPYGMQDIAGIDVGARIRQYLASIGKTRAEGPQSEVPDRLFAMGRYGQKTGAGWYKYEAGSRERIPDPLIDQLAAEAAAKRGIARRAIDDEEILARVTTALANEGARVLEDGFAIRAGDIDVIYCYGFGFPRHRGGPMFYAETVGLKTVLSRVHEYRARFGDYWEPAPLLERLVAEGKSFYGEG